MEKMPWCQGIFSYHVSVMDANGMGFVILL